MMHVRDCHLPMDFIIHWVRGRHLKIDLVFLLVFYMKESNDVARIVQFVYDDDAVMYFSC